MKKYFLFAIAGILINANRLTASPADSTELFYVGFGGGTGSINGIHAQLSFSVDKNWIGGIHYYYGERTSDLTPSDYSPGLKVFGPTDPQDELNSVSFTVGYYRFASRSFRYGLSGGVLVGSYSDPYNFIPIVSSGFLDFGPNYNYSRKTGTYAGLLLHPEIFISSRRCGLNIGLSLDTNPHRNQLMVDIGIVYGVLR